MDRYTIAEEDLIFLKQKQSSLSPKNIALIFLCEGKIAIIKNDIEYGLSCFESAIRKSPGSASAIEAEKLLLEWEE